MMRYEKMLEDTKKASLPMAPAAANTMQPTLNAVKPSVQTLERLGHKRKSVKQYQTRLPRKSSKTSRVKNTLLHNSDSEAELSSLNNFAGDMLEEQHKDKDLLQKLEQDLQTQRDFYAKEIA
jgi:hypothetical protein